ncbi:lysylphosphatidylglycerol synthase transmembrane domain-containing protein [Lentimicrobium sp.]
MPRLLKVFLKIALSVAALWYVFTRIDPREVGQMFTQANYAWLLAATLAFVVSKYFSALRLNIFLENIGARLSRISNLKLYLLGMYYNLFLPGGIGGDGYKIYLLNKRFAIKAKPLFWAIFLDRVNGVLVLGLLALGMIPFLNLPYPYMFWAVAGILVAIVAYWLVLRYFFPDFKQSVLSTNAYSLAVQLFQLLSAAFILFANHHQEQLLAYLFLFLVSSIVATLPITIGGIGSREIAFLFGSRLLQLDLQQSIALSLMFYVITALVSLAGIYFSLNEKAMKLQARTCNTIK